MDRVAALADAVPLSFWLDDSEAPEPLAPLARTTRADLTVVGGGYSGLWAALLAKESDPSRDVVVLEGDRCGWAASGRNGGFCAATLTHGLPNGIERWPDELATLERLGEDNLDGIERSITTHGIECEFERTGSLDVATEPWQVDDLGRYATMAAEHGADVRLLDQDEVRAEVHSPTYLAGLLEPSGTALVHPAKLAWGLRSACLALGVRIFEHTPVTGLTSSGPGPADPITITTAHGQVTSTKVVLATNAFPSPVKRLRKYTVPVYDYVLMTEPLSAEQMESIGWTGRQGLGGVGNQFLYYRLSADNRILFGGYDAIYRYGRAMGPDIERDPTTHRRLAELFEETFPQLADVRFTHAWAGAIDTCSRFCAFFDLGHDGRVASVAGYTGMGVGASRFGAQVALDLVSGTETERTRLTMVRTKPIPFPPEPLASIGIQMTRWSLARADANRGKRNLWLKALDAAGMGFDS